MAPANLTWQLQNHCIAEAKNVDNPVSEVFLVNWSGDMKDFQMETAR
jgi:hypothetical protein